LIDDDDNVIYDDVDDCVDDVDYDDVDVGNDYDDVYDDVDVGNMLMVRIIMLIDIIVMRIMKMIILICMDVDILI
jgi:hypothetical protein